MEVPAGLVGMHWSLLERRTTRERQKGAELFLILFCVVLRLRIHAVHYGE